MLKQRRMVAEQVAGALFEAEAAIDAALAKNPKLSAADMAKVKQLRAEGETAHKAGKHQESVDKLGEAMKILKIDNTGAPAK